MSSNKCSETSPSGEQTEEDVSSCNFFRPVETSRPSKERTWHSFHQPWFLLLNHRLPRMGLLTGPERPHTKDPGDGCLPPAKGHNHSPDASARGATIPRLSADHPLTLRSGVILKRCSGMVTMQHACLLAQGVRAPIWGASAARHLLRAEAAVCHGSEMRCHLESCSGAAMSSLVSCCH